MRAMMLVAATLLATTAFTNNASAVETVRLCTGEQGLPYQQVGKAIKSLSNGSRVLSLELVENTGGTSNNIDRATQGKRTDSGSCDAFIGQPNGINDLASKDRSMTASIQQVGSANNEYAQIVCSKSSGITSIKELVKNPRKYTIALGGTGSGAWLLWQSFVEAEPKLSDVGVTAEDKALALVAVANNNTTCAAFPEGLKGRWMNTANAQYGGKVVLIDSDLGAFGKIKDFRGNPMYRYTKIPAGTYPKVQTGGGFFSSAAVGTVMWDAGIYVNTDRVTDSRVLAELVSIISRAAPIINRNLNVAQ